MKKIVKVLVILILLVGIIGAGVYFINERKQKTDNKTEESKNEDSRNDANVSENGTKNKSLTEEEMYGMVLSDYKKAISEYDENDVNSLDSIEKKYSIVNSTIIFQVVRHGDEENEISYDYYDIDKNGTKELIVGVSDLNGFYEGAIYSYDKDTNEPKKIYYQDTMERGTLHIYDNGVILSEGSGGAALHYYTFGRIDKNGSSYESIENIEETYTQEGENAIYKDYKENKVLNYKNLDEIKDKYLSNSSVVKFKNYNKLQNTDSKEISWNGEYSNKSQTDDYCHEASIKVEKQTDNTLEFSMSAVHGRDIDHVNMGEVKGKAKKVFTKTNIENGEVACDTYLFQENIEGKEYKITFIFSVNQVFEGVEVKQDFPDDVNPYAGHNVTFEGKYEKIK